LSGDHINVDGAIGVFTGEKTAFVIFLSAMIDTGFKKTDG